MVPWTPARPAAGSILWFDIEDENLKLVPDSLTG